MVLVSKQKAATAAGLDHDEQAIRLEACESIAKFLNSAAEHAPALKRCLRSPSQKVRDAAMYSLRKLRREGVIVDSPVALQCFVREENGSATLRLSSISGETLDEVTCEPGIDPFGDWIWDHLQKKLGPSIYRIVPLNAQNSVRMLPIDEPIDEVHGTAIDLFHQLGGPMRMKDTESTKVDVLIKLGRLWHHGSRIKMENTLEHGVAFVGHPCEQRESQSSEGALPQWKAVQRGNDQFLRDVFSIGDMHLCTSSDFLHAVCEGNEAALRCLQAIGCIDVKDKWGRTPLIMAAHKGDSGASQSLLGAKANIWIQGPAGNTALMEAVVEGHTFVVHLLLCALANAEASGECGETALTLAAASGCEAIVRKLLAHRGKISGAAAPGRCKRWYRPGRARLSRTSPPPHSCGRGR